MWTGSGAVGGEEECEDNDDLIRIINVCNDPGDREKVIGHAPMTSPILDSGLSKQMDAEIFQVSLKEGIMLSERGHKYKREGNMIESLDCYKEALRRYKLCYAYYTDRYHLNSYVANDDCNVGGGLDGDNNENSPPPVSLELSIALTLQIMAIFHDHGLSEAPSAVEAHETTIYFLLKELNNGYDNLEFNDDNPECVTTPQRPKSTKVGKQTSPNLSPTSVLSQLGTAPDPSSRLCNVLKLTQHERIRLISASLNALAKLYFQEEQTKPDTDENKEDALSYHQHALNLLKKVYPLATSSFSSLCDHQLKIDFTQRDTSKPQSKNSPRFNIDLRIDTGNTLMQMGQLLCFRRDYENAAVCFEDALEIRKELHKNDEEKEVMDACYSLGIAYEQNKDFDMALQSYDVVFESTKKTYGHESVEAAKLCCDKSRILRQQDDIPGSLSWNGQAVALYRKHVSTCESDILQQLIEALKRRGELFIEMKNAEQAILSHREMMEMQISHLGPEHPDIAHTLLLLGDLYLSTKELPEARKVLIEALNLFSEFGTGTHDPDLKLTLTKIEIVFRLEEEEKTKSHNAKKDISMYDQKNRNRSNNLACTRIQIDEINNSEEEKKMKGNHKENSELMHKQKSIKESNNTINNNTINNINYEMELVEEEDSKYCKVTATKSRTDYYDDGVSQITFLDNEGNASRKNRRKKQEPQRGHFRGDCLITSCVSEVVETIADATGKLLNGSDCHRHLLADNMSIQSESKIDVAVHINDGDSAIESTLLGMGLLSVVSEDDTQETSVISRQDSILDGSLYGVGLVSLQHDDESQNHTKSVKHEESMGCANVDDLLAQMYVVTCEMEYGGQGKPFKEMLQVEKNNDKNGKDGSSLTSKTKKKRSLEKKIYAYHNLLLDRREQLGKTHSKVLDTMLALAKLYSRNKEHSKAILTYLDVEMIQAEKLGEQNVEVALTCMKIGDSYLAQGKFDIAMQNYLKARDMQLNIFGETHPIIASTLNSMGLVELERGDFDAAMDYLQHALRIQQIHLAPNEHNPDISQTLVNIGAVYYKERNSFSKLRKREDTYKSFIESGMLGRIAFAHGERGEYIMAMHFYAEVLQLLRYRGEERSLPGIVMTLNCLGNLSTKTGRYMVAMDSHNQALNALQKSQEADEVDIADTLGYLGVVEYYSGNFQKALDLFRQVCPKQRRLLGTSHPRVARTIYHEGVVNCILCKYDEAMRNLGEALKMQLTVLQKDHPDTLNTCLAIGIVHFELDRFDAALTHFEEVLHGQKNNIWREASGYCPYFKLLRSCTYKKRRDSGSYEFFCEKL